ncbi:9271_t:CDS:2, partial [Gigaspora margarita]
QIELHKKLYNEELDLLYENPEHLDKNENLRPEILEEFLDKFSTNILTVIPALTPTILQLARNLYFEDFVATTSTNSGYPNEPDTNSDVLIAELELARMCPSIIEIMSKKSKTLQFLRICNNLILTQLINILDIVDAINFKCKINPENQEPDLDNQESDLENQESDLDNQESNLDNQDPNFDPVDNIDNINTNKTQPDSI